MSWTEERIARLKILWEGGKTASQIAEDLGEVTRNAVIGKAHRLGLQSRPSPVKTQESATALDATPAPPRAEPAVAAPAPAPAPKAAPAPAPAAPVYSAPAYSSAPNAPSMPPPNALTGAQIGSIGPGGFLRQGPGDQLPPSQPAPPRRLVPAKPSPEIAGKTTLLDLSDRICKWPLGHPGEPDFHFCGDKVNPGFPYCVVHCGHAYQAQILRRERTGPLPMSAGTPSPVQD
jgi:GcrA cell cycle regulator